MSSSVITSYKLWLIKLLFNTSYFGRRVITGRADSGVTFDHVYLNRAKGHLPIIGRLIDRLILNLPSLRATRERWVYISNEILKLLPAAAQKDRIRIIDLASGASRYLVDLAKNETEHQLECVCLDRDKESIQLGKRIGDPREFRYCRADLFETEKLLNFGLKIGWRPQIAIAIGLIEYLDEKALDRLLKHLRKLLASGGYFILSSQIKNPSQYLMENICKTSSGKPWKLYYRDPVVIRSISESNGFDIKKVHVDRYGMYSIFTIQKNSSKVE